MAHLSKQNAQKILKEGTLVDSYTTQCDNGIATVYRVRHTNGIEFMIFMLNGEIISR